MFIDALLGLAAQISIQWKNKRLRFPQTWKIYIHLTAIWDGELIK